MNSNHIIGGFRLGTDNLGFTFTLCDMDGNDTVTFSGYATEDDAIAAGDAWLALD